MHVNKESPIYAMSESAEPIVKVDEAQRFTVDLHDCFTGRIRNTGDKFGPEHWPTVNPATGPIFIRNAHHGDVLAIHIHSISINSPGVMVVSPGMGAFANSVLEDETRLLNIRDGFVEFSDSLRVPVKPMVGVIGVAPDGEAVPCGTPGEHGANMDCTLIGMNSKVFLPVFHEGALLSLGDLHAIMGDGEVGLSGVECSGTVCISVKVLNSSAIPTPLIETGKVFAAIASGKTLDECQTGATGKMLSLLENQFGIERNSAIMLLSAFGDLNICQVVNPLKTCRMEISKKVLVEYGVDVKLY